MLCDRSMTTIVHFLDETFEEVAYDICTNIQEATEQLAATIKLENYSTFTLFDCRKVSHPKPCESWLVIATLYCLSP